MDHLPDACPPSPLSLDSDEYNTESARVYFGPVKTPERKFVAASQGLFPPPEGTGALRRSPRLSSPRLRSASPMEPETMQTDNDDIEQVELLVNASEEDESGDLLDSGTATPQKGDDTLDEPSSALADKILHAHDNPSPPPSPPSALRIFDPYHTTIALSSNDYQSDLMFLNISDRTEGDSDQSLTNAVAGATDDDIFPLPNGQEPALNPGELIPIDPIEPTTPTDATVGGSLFPSHLALSVDDLLSKSPSPQKVQNQQVPQGVPEVPAVVVQPAASDAVMPSGVLESSLPSAAEVGGQSSEFFTEQRNEQQPADSEVAQTPQEATTAAPETLAVTPLRRSSRPRKSVTPNILPETPPVAPPAAIPSSTTKVRRKQVVADSKDEVVSDSQDEVESRPLAAEQQSATSTVRVRHRSPAKALPSFSRELGSLSPTSSNLLSTLNFAVPDGQTGNESSGQSSSSAAPMLSFSVFTPPTDTAAPSTPVRSTGPIRFSSPAKVGISASPSKFTLQPPAPNDPTNTPARRVPVSQAIAEGRISPEKSTQPGFRFSNTPLPSVPTPARRVLVSEGPPSMAMKASTMRLASPTRSLQQRAPSAEPRLGSSLKGKEKAIQEPVGAVAKLPFPIVAQASSSASAESSTSTAQPNVNQDNIAKAKASPVKSSLRQPTSRIPRIGAKPYARATETKAAEKPKTIRKVESVVTVKPLPKTSTSETASSIRKNVRATAEPAKPPAATTSRVKPTVSTAAAVLKRKREQDKTSSVKPRIVRQVPQVVVPAAAHTQAAPAPPSAAAPAPKAKKAGSTTRQIRRVMDPEPPKAPPAQQQEPPPPPPQQSSSSSPPQPQQDTPLEQDMVTDAPAPSIPEVVVSLAPDIATLEQHSDLTPGSPMKQDPSPTPLPSDKPVEVPPSFNVVPEIVVDAGDTGLRRTTRSKRAAPVRDVFTEGSSRQTTSTRRKPVAFHSDDVFSGMSMTALKDLTVSNTVKNQRYLTVQLETEVVRREGLRPESPAVKIKTILQRQQDERDRRNEERARRRERRSDGGMSDVDRSSDIDIDDAGYSSQIDELMDDTDGEGDLPKHTRGAGEDDDYVTPERLRRNFKGTRLFSDALGAQEEDNAPPRRSVKWDRGLFTTVYLDEVKLGSRQYLKENRDLKGILAPTAKAIRLDTLGNHPHAETPLTDLVQENVTVKKIVYDDDEAPAAPEPAPPKPTRAKAKRK